MITVRAGRRISLSMKRDPDLSRAILLYIEEHSPPSGGLEKRIQVAGYDYPEILAHTRLLIEENLIDGQMIDALAGPVEVVIWKLTARGHDAIEVTRSDAAWDRAKRIAEEHGAPLTFNFLVEILKAEARRQVGLS